MGYDLEVCWVTPKLVIFDCDGVLVDTETITSEVMSASFARYGLHISPVKIHELFIGGTMISAGEEAVRRGAELPSDWYTEVSREVVDAIAKGVSVFDGIHDLLDALEDRFVQIAVASNGPMAKMKVSLGPSGLWKRFEGRIYTGRDHAPKPAPDMLLHAVKVAGVRPADAVMIDDTINGTRAADRAGMRAIGFAAASDAQALVATGHPVAMTMAEVGRLLGVDD